jgi:hypothetical protein
MGNFEFAMNFNGGNFPPVVRDLPVAATQTLVKGDLVVLSGGKVAKAGTSVTGILGVMAEDSDGAAAGTMVAVYLARPGHVWRATADADATSHVLAAIAYDINSDQTVDVGDNSNGALSIVGLVGESTTRVYVMFHEFALP